MRAALRDAARALLGRNRNAAATHAWMIRGKIHALRNQPEAAIEARPDAFGWITAAARFWQGFKRSGACKPEGRAASGRAVITP